MDKRCSESLCLEVTLEEGVEVDSAESVAKSFTRCRLNAAIEACLLEWWRRYWMEEASRTGLARRRE